MTKSPFFKPKSADKMMKKGDKTSKKADKTTEKGDKMKNTPFFALDKTVDASQKTVYGAK
jgi:hypothetical protein